MFDPNALDVRWTLLIGLPVIVWLSVVAWRRTQTLVTRIRDVRLEMARQPQNPYQALAELMADEPNGKTKSGKNAGRR